MSEKGIWQNCPHCKGTGQELYGTHGVSQPICTVCNGAKIISQLTGLPPYSMNSSTAAHSILPKQWGEIESMTETKNKVDLLINPTEESRKVKDTQKGCREPKS